MDGQIFCALLVFQSSYLLFEHFVTFDIVLIIRHIGQEVMILSFTSCFFAKDKFDTAKGPVRNWQKNERLLWQYM